MRTHVAGPPVHVDTGCIEARQPISVLRVVFPIRPCLNHPKSHTWLGRWAASPAWFVFDCLPESTLPAVETVSYSMLLKLCWRQLSSFQLPQEDFLADRSWRGPWRPFRFSSNRVSEQIILSFNPVKKSMRQLAALPS